MKKIIACMIVLSVLMSSVAFANTVDFKFDLRPTDMENDFATDEKSRGYKNDNEARFMLHRKVLHIQCLRAIQSTIVPRRIMSMLSMFPTISQ